MIDDASYAYNSAAHVNVIWSWQKKNFFLRHIVYNVWDEG